MYRKNEVKSNEQIKVNELESYNTREEDSKVF